MPLLPRSVRKRPGSIR